MSVPEFLNLKGRSAVVIGGTGVLGSAMARGLLDAGASLVIAGRDSDRGKALVEAWNTDSREAKSAFVQVDATCKQSVEELLDGTLATSGHVDILINAAGANDDTPFLEIESCDWDQILDVNLKSVFYACQVFGRYLIDRGRGGSIINIGSMAGITPLSRVFAYSAAKAGMMNLTKNLAREWAPYGIRVNCIAPGFFPAEQNRKLLSEERIASIINNTPMNRFGNAQELVGMAVLLAGMDGASFITGATIPIDGGFSASSI